MINQIKKLCSLAGASGFEDEVRDYILSEIKPFLSHYSIDSMGNIIAFKKGKKSPKQKILIAAHMDEVGFIIKNITDDGMIKFGIIGGIDKKILLGKRVVFGNVRGIIGIKAVHLTSMEERKSLQKDFYIDIGANNKKEAENLVALGDYGVFDSGIFDFGEGLLLAKALDDRVGCAILINLIKSDLEFDLNFLFSVQEEVGLRGAIISSYEINPDICVVIESTTSADLPNVSESKQVCKIFGGAVIPFMDSGTIYDEKLWNILRDLAIKHEIKWQTKELIAGGTDAGKIHLSRNGVSTVAISVPTRYIHSPSSVCAIEDIESVFKLINVFIKEGLK